MAYVLCFFILRLRLRPTAEGRSLSGPNIRLRPKVKIVPTVQHCFPISNHLQPSPSSQIIPRSCIEYVINCTVHAIYCTFAHISKKHTLAPYKFDPINHQIKRWVAELKAIAKILLIKFCGVFSFMKQNLPQVIYKPHCHYQNFSPLANGLYLIATTNKTPMYNANCPVMEHITKMGVAHTVRL